MALATKKDFDDVCSYFISKIQSPMVYLEETERKWDQKHLHGIFQFKIIFSLKDKYIELHTYESGYAYIYPSDKLYHDIDELGEKLFGEKPNWNNTKTTGFFVIG